MLKVVTGTKATLAQSDSPFVEELRTLCKQVQRGTLEMPTSALTNEEVCDESIRVSCLDAVSIFMSSRRRSANPEDGSACCKTSWYSVKEGIRN